MKIRFGKVSKGIAGAVAGMVTGNTGTIAMTPDQIASMPWWGVLVANVVYAAIGFGLVYLAPANAPAEPETTTPPAAQ